MVVTVRLGGASMARRIVGFGCPGTTARMQTVNVKKNITGAEFAKTVLICTVSINSKCSRVPFLLLYHASNRDFLIVDQPHRVLSACHVTGCPLNISGVGETGVQPAIIERCKPSQGGGGTD